MFLSMVFSNNILEFTKKFDVSLWSCPPPSSLTNHSRTKHGIALRGHFQGKNVFACFYNRNFDRSFWPFLKQFPFLSIKNTNEV